MSFFASKKRPVLHAVESGEQGSLFGPEDRLVEPQKAAAECSIWPKLSCLRAACRQS